MTEKLSVFNRGAAKDGNVILRANKTDIAKLHETARSMGTTASELIRMSVNQYVTSGDSSASHQGQVPQES